MSAQGTGSEEITERSEVALEVALVLALREDLATGDLTTTGLGLARRRAQARLLAKADGVVCGVHLLEWIARTGVLDTPLEGGVEDVLARLGGHATAQGQSSVAPASVRDGARVSAGQLLAELQGEATILLALERSLLNLLCHLSGIATLTARYVAETNGTNARICDTRKTIAGLRLLQKYAVRCGGGVNHRMGLWDEAMLKENHLKLWGLGIEAAITSLRASAPGRRITCETENIEEARCALRAGADCVLLDELSLADMREVVRLRAEMGCEHIPLEASGGVSLATVREIALTGVDRISIGALTHSAPALDLSLKIVPVDSGGAL